MYYSEYSTSSMSNTFTPKCRRCIIKEEDTKILFYLYTEYKAHTNSQLA